MFGQWQGTFDDHELLLVCWRKYTYIFVSFSNKDFYILIVILIIKCQQKQCDNSQLSICLLLYPRLNRNFEWLRS